MPEKTLAGQASSRCRLDPKGCNDLAALKEKVANLEADVLTNTREIRNLIELAAQIKLLMSLAIGGGAMSLLNLVLFFLNNIH
ncbi:MAG: hypothetical protein A2X25_14425 [Chloroflexi bacterium GWB2_49_20]|nr:MAG: hypothetical protein A2X25_14425 [Chloroflexi bacterium GWB2_49_20]OGN77290.1 MAG: hypothetical protein A2X26_08820 [Chloroflexi bacterium GWC2_49_37]OGN84713.1 MAG: hypothetical protein A2X27_15285 [Chloroflexi bacterium GWD2_49_16]HBG75124.1 hypothetical protein [Anaerolineae bacterium]HCC78475.1 hypothetical protein [Anaerolineae bacterium]